MSHFYNAIFATCLILFSVQTWALQNPVVELRTQNRIAKGEPAVFLAKVLVPGIKKMRLRYKNADEVEFKWVDFQAQSPNELRAFIGPEEISGSALLYYIVWQKADNSIEAAYGSPSEPFRISVDRRRGNAVLRHKVANQKSKTTPISFRDRFGDDEISEQISVFSASDAFSRTGHFETWGRPGARMSADRVEQRGARDLVDVLRSFPKMDFNYGDDFRLQPVFGGIAGPGRVRLKIDGLELYDDFDGSSEWTLDSLSVAGVAIMDTPAQVLGESSGLLGTIGVGAKRKNGVLTRIRGGWPADYTAGLVAGKSLGRFENYWTASLRQSPSALVGSSLLKTEYWWDREKRPFMTGQLQVFANVPEKQRAKRYIWNGAINFELPFTSKINSRLAFLAGQTFSEASELDIRTYRLFRIGLQSANDFRLNSSHLLQLNGEAGFVGVASSPFVFERTVGKSEKSTFELSGCDALGVRTSVVSNCRLKGALSIRDRYQIVHWTALSTGLEIAGAVKESSNLASLLHPSILLEIAPSDDIGASVGYSSSLRWPTFLEMGSKPAENEVVLTSERLKQVMLAMEWKLPLQYAHFTFSGQGRLGWLHSPITPSQNLAGSRVWMNLETISYSGLNFGLTAKLASANQVYFGTELHSESVLFPRLKMVFAALLNLGEVGSLHVEVQSLSQSPLYSVNAPTRLQIFYQSRPLFQHIVFEALVANALSLAQLNENDSVPGVYGSMKIFL